jgi:hypothetical protein
LEYISRLFGIHVQFDEMYWGVLGWADNSITYSQIWADDTYTLKLTGELGVGSLNGKDLFSVSHGVRVVTDWAGKVKRIICIAQERLTVRYLVNGEWKTSVMDPNQIITFE